MNQGKKNIEYADKSWNPYSGCEIKDCAINEHIGKCWAKKRSLMLAGRYGYSATHPFRPTFHEDKLKRPYNWQKPRRIDCCFMGDLSCAKKEWIEKILQVIKNTGQHRYYILTKNPKNLIYYEFPFNAWVGVTINCLADIYRITDLVKVKAWVKWISFEPLYEFFEFIPVSIDWIVIGAQTNPEFQPKKLWVDNILRIADDFEIPVFMKNNLKYEPKRFEFP